MSNQEETRKNNPERKRSYLFLSMILLVWNLIATTDFFLKNDSSGVSPTPIQPSVSGIHESTQTLENISGIQEKTLSLRQKYLIGKQIDINKASIEEFNSLPGVSNAMAAAIVAERERIGGFSSPNDLMRVKGIKEKRLEKILPFIKKTQNN